jgi:hypothetical protein
MSAADRGISEVAGARWMCDRIKLEFKLPKS